LFADGNFHINSRDYNAKRGSTSFLHRNDVLRPIWFGCENFFDGTPGEANLHHLLIEFVVHIHVFGKIVSLKNYPIGLASSIFRTAHLNARMPFLQIFPIGNMERGIGFIYGHGIAAPTLLNSFLDDMATPLLAAA
jgi:hypothetical protein